MRIWMERLEQAGVAGGLHLPVRDGEGEGEGKGKAKASDNDHDGSTSTSDPSKSVPGVGLTSFISSPNGRLLKRTLSPNVKRGDGGHVNRDGGGGSDVSYIPHMPRAGLDAYNPNDSPGGSDSSHGIILLGSDDDDDNDNKVPAMSNAQARAPVGDGSGDVEVGGTTDGIDVNKSSSKRHNNVEENSEDKDSVYVYTAADNSENNDVDTITIDNNNNNSSVKHDDKNDINSVVSNTVNTTGLLPVPANDGNHNNHESITMNSEFDTVVPAADSLDGARDRHMFATNNMNWNNGEEKDQGGKKDSDQSQTPTRKRSAIFSTFSMRVVCSV